MKRTSKATHKTYVLAIDQGTVSSRAIIFDHSGCVESVGQKGYGQIFPHPSRVEHNPVEIWPNVREVLGLVLADATTKAGHEINHHDIAAMSIISRHEATVVWNKYIGQPVYNAIVRQDARSQDLVDRLAVNGNPDRQHSIVGETLSTHASIIKLMWILENTPGVRERTECRGLLFGNLDTQVIWNLTGGINGGIHITDVTNVSRTMLMNLHTPKWRENICQETDIPMSMLPEICSSSETCGECRQDDLLAGVKLAGDLGDQQAATFGRACFEPGIVKNTYGMGCFMLVNADTKPQPSENGMITIVYYKIGGEAPIYALEGSVTVAGPLMQWLRDNLRIIDSAPECDTLAESVQDNGGVCFVPAFSGLFTPYRRDDARGAIVGMTCCGTKGHLACATLKTAAYQTRRASGTMGASSGVKLGELHMDGGMTKSNVLMQFQSGMLGVLVVLPQIAETAAPGAVYAIGVVVGYWSGTQDIINSWQE